MSPQQSPGHRPATVQKLGYRQESRKASAKDRSHWPQRKLSCPWWRISRKPHACPRKQDTPSTGTTPGPITSSHSQETARTSPRPPPDWPPGQRAGPLHRPHGHPGRALPALRRLDRDGDSARYQLANARCRPAEDKGLTRTNVLSPHVSHVPLIKQGHPGALWAPGCSHPGPRNPASPRRTCTRPSPPSASLPRQPEEPLPGKRDSLQRLQRLTETLNEVKLLPESEPRQTPNCLPRITELRHRWPAWKRGSDPAWSLDAPSIGDLCPEATRGPCPSLPLTTTVSPLLPQGPVRPASSPGRTARQPQGTALLGEAHTQNPVLPHPKPPLAEKTHWSGVM